MFGIRPVFVQDENAGPGTSVRASVRNKENLTSMSTLGKPASQPLAGNVRRALGNITNTSSRGSENVPAGQQATKPGLNGGKEGRRALGDITNSALSKSTSRSNEPAKSKLFQHPTIQKPLNPVSASTRAPLTTRSKADIYADDGIEHLAGKSWVELEAERKQRETADIENRVRKLTMGLPVWRPTITCCQDFDSDDDMELILSPSPIRKPVARLPSFTNSQNADDGLLLPSAALDLSASLPDFGDSDLDLDFDELI